LFEACARTIAPIARRLPLAVIWRMTPRLAGSAAAKISVPPTRDHRWGDL
jgi:hypothetical protein